MSRKTLYIFHPEYDVSAMLSGSTLLTSLDQSMDQSQYHTSLGDMTATDIIAASKNFSTVELIDIGFDYESAIWHETKILLNYLSHCCTVKGFTKNKPDTFVESELMVDTFDHQQLWIFGCSHSHGTGLIFPEQRFGNIVAKNLNLPATFVTQPGSSLQWSLRHLVNSNIKINDVVIWQITTPYRVTLYNNTATETILATSNNRCLLDTFNDQQIFFHHCSLLNYGVKYLRALGVKFALTSLLAKDDLFYQYLDEYTKYPEYCYIPEVPLDLGTDNLHAGPLSHQVIAKRITDRVQYKDE